MFIYSFISDVKKERWWNKYPSFHQQQQPIHVQLFISLSIHVLQYFKKYLHFITQKHCTTQSKFVIIGLEVIVLLHLQTHEAKRPPAPPTTAQPP